MTVTPPQPEPSGPQHNPAPDFAYAEGDDDGAEEIICDPPPTQAQTPLKRWSRSLMIRKTLHPPETPSLPG